MRITPVIALTLTRLIGGLTVVLVALQAARGDDIDIYLQQHDENNAPYVQLTLDYQPALFAPLCRYGEDCRPPFMTPAAYAALGDRAVGETVSRFDGLVAVLEAVFADPLLAEVRLALLVSNYETRSPPPQHGASILSGYRRLGAEGNALLAILKSIVPLTDSAQAHPLQPRHALLEWYLYLNGDEVLDGSATAQNFRAGGGRPAHDPTILTPDGSRYLAPMNHFATCSRFYSIFMALGPGADRDDVDALLRARFGVAAGQTFAEFWRYLHGPETDLVRSVASSQPLTRSWLVSAPEAGDWRLQFGYPGDPVARLEISSPLSLQAGLVAALSGVADLTASMAGAVALAGSGQWGGTEISLLYSLFAPRATHRWPGNVKKLRLVDLDADGRPETPVDADGRPAGPESGSDSLIRFDALTLWTDEQALPPGDGHRVPLRGDGAVVTRGGAGQRIPGYPGSGKDRVGDVNGEAGARQLFVEPSDPEVPGPAALAALDATPLNAGTLRQALGVADEREALQLLRWVRGQDVDDEDGDGDIAEAREWLLGEVLHSRPLPINYGAVDGYTRENPNIHIAFGAGDGALHILENTDRAGNESGAELLAFYPRELLPLLRARRHNTGSSRPMRYGVDGAAAVFTEDRNGDGNLDHVDGDKVYLFFGLRRGGTSYFALDISDPRATPVLLWRISRTRGGDFDELGLSFSPPLVTRVRYRGEVTDALVFAAGYNGGWTADAADRVGKDAGAADDDVGNAVYIVELATGELIWKAVRGATGSISNTRYQHAGLIDSIPSGVTALVSGSGIAHRLYAGDSGGAVWRLDLPQGDSIDHRRDNWSISKLAELGEDGITDDRRFFHAPELVESVDENGAFDGVIIASGDRAHPGRREVINYLFYLKDRAISSGDRSVRVRRPQTLAGLPERSDCLGNDADPESCRAPLTPGWKLRLRAVGEKGLSTPLVDAGRLFFSTFIPSPPGACGPPIGQGVLYQLNLADASSQPGRTRDQFLGPGIPSGAIVTGDAILLPALATGSLTGPEMNSPEILLPRRSGRPRYLYWRQSGVDDR